MENKELVTIEAQESISARVDVQKEVLSFKELMDMSAMLAKSTIVPIQYQNRPENTFVALDMASRMGVSPIMVMQNLYVVQGKPSWSGSAMCAMLRASKEYKDVDLIYTGTPNTDSWGAYVQATKVRTGKVIKGGEVTIAVAKKEGWYQKSGSKWQSMPEIMLAYRAYAWFVRVHCPELCMGLQSNDEVVDVTPVVGSAVNPFEGV